MVCLRCEMPLLHHPGWYNRFIALVFGEGNFGYVAYDCDLTNYLHYGSTNRLLIVAKTEPLSSRWYSGGGVCRGVWLYEGGAIHVAPGSFCLVTTAVEPEGIAFRLKAVLQSLDAAAREVRLCLTLAKDGETCLQRELTVRVKGGGSFTLDRQFYLPGAAAWSDAEPALYDAALSVWDGDALLDSETQRTGFCLLRWDARRGLRVNGRSVKLRGACLHHDEGLLGGVSTVDYEYRRVRRLKAAGFNAVRSAHNHAAPALLAACDALGVYVLDEVCDMWTKMKGYEDYTQYFSSSWKQTVTAMVAENRTHPCVVGYSTGNEISDICTDKGIETSHEMYLLFRQLDQTRFVTNGINGAFAAGDGLAQIAADLTGQPPQTFAARLVLPRDRLRSAHPAVSLCAAAGKIRYAAAVRALDLHRCRGELDLCRRRGPDRYRRGLCAGRPGHAVPERAGGRPRHGAEQLCAV